MGVPVRATCNTAARPLASQGEGSVADQICRPETPPSRFASASAAAAFLVFLYLVAFQLPATPIYDADNMPVYLLEGSEMLNGQMIYRDFFEFTFPGTQLTYQGLFGLFGPRIWIPMALIVLIGLGLAWTGILVSRRLVRGKAVFVPSLAFLAFAVSDALDTTHHWFSILAVMAALAILIEGRTTTRVFASGLLAGLATDFTQTRGPLVVLAFSAFLVWEWRTSAKPVRWLSKRAAVLAAGFLLSTLPLVYYFGGRVGWGRFFYSTCVFPMKYYSLWDYNTFRHYMVDIPDFSGILLAPALAIWLLVFLLQPLVYVLLFARFWLRSKREPGEPWPELMLLSLTGLALFLTIASAPNWLKIASSSLPAFIMLVWFLQSGGLMKRILRLALWAAAATVAVAQVARMQLDRAPVLELPSGTLASPDPARYEKLKWLSAHLQPGEALYEAGDADLYFPLGLANPTPISFLTPSGYTRQEQVSEVIQALQQGRVRWAVWTAWLDAPTAHESHGDHLAPLRAYLRDHYRIAKTFRDGDEAWERDPEPLSTGPAPRRSPMQ
jgi:hypothetical protein